MFDNLLPAIEESIRDDKGAMPAVFEGLEHILEKKTPTATSSVHPNHELFYLRNGKVEFTICGRKVAVEKGSTLIIRPNTAHSVRVISDIADTIVLRFGFSREREDMRFALPSLESFMDFAQGEEAMDDMLPFILLSGSYKKSIGNIMERIVDEKNGDEISKDLMMRILTVELMVTLSRAMKREWEESLRVRNGKARELVLIARDYIDANYDRGITVANAASYVYLSQGYFTRAFREEFGMSPMSYLMKKRIDKACELLENNEIKVSGIALQAGFSSPQRFNVAFRKQKGMTPMEYRKKHGNNFG
ncbi:MAG: helix-turn-helix domain-containing protein [Clostridiales bacterium]|nr:helix-turn-helix domain-containing protein [Clostridiales bacterium]MBR6484728.1 helix-turn-helix domain-containing protein [Clostridiales bacterium]